MSGIFINYRNINRSYAPMLIDQVLRLRFGTENVFQAGRSNHAASSFEERIMRRLAECTLLIALIDKPWVTEDLYLLQKDGDWVRREIRYALEHGKQVLPVLLGGAEMPKSADVPSDIAPMTKLMALRMRPSTADADLERLAGEVERLVPDLVLATLTDPPPTARPRNAALLRAEYELYPFKPRPELDELVRWASDPIGAKVRMVTGPAGAGKTRLGLRVSARLRGMGWQAGMLSAAAADKALDRLGAIRTPCLVVIDDAERRQAQVAAALRSLAGAPDAPGRLLLLARSDGQWLDGLYSDASDGLWTLAKGISPVRIEPLMPEAADFSEVYDEFARYFDDPPPPPVPAPRAATMLQLQAVILAHLASPGDPAESPWQRVLDIERGYWKDVAQAVKLNLSAANMAEIMVAVTLFGADEPPEAEELIRSLRAMRGHPLSDVDSCLDLLRAVLPGRSPLNPIQPDQLGEDIIADFFRSPQGRPDWSGLVAVLTDRQAERAILALGKSLARYPDLGDHVAAFLRYAPGRLLKAAIAALPLVPQPERLAEAMTQALDAIPPCELDGLVATLWQRGEAQAAFAVAVTERALAAAQQAGHIGIPTARLARLLATRLVYLGGRQADAVRAASAAVTELEALACQPVDDELTAELAEAHAALALALDQDPGSAAKARAAGAAAIAAYRGLPASQRHDGALATALHNQAIRLKRAGQVPAALALSGRAHELTSSLHDARPASFRSLHADVEDTLSELLYADDQKADAERMRRDALGLRRTLAQARPDAYRPQLAATLYNLGLILASADGEHAEVRELWTESLGIYDDLARHQPGRFDQDRARVLDRLNRLDNPGLGEWRPDG